MLTFCEALGQIVWLRWLIKTSTVYVQKKKTPCTIALFLYQSERCLSIVGLNMFIHKCHYIKYTVSSYSKDQNGSMQAYTVPLFNKICEHLTSIFV